MSTIDGKEVRERWMTTDEVCQYLQISPATLWRLVKNGRLPRGAKLGTLNRWKRLEVDAAVGRGKA